MSDMAVATATRAPAGVGTQPGRLLSRIDRLFVDLGRQARNLFDFRAPAPAPGLGWIEKDGEYRLTIELPGTAEDQLEVGVADGVLTVSHEMGAGQREEHGRVTGERRCGAFRRQFALPVDVEPGTIRAEVDRGALRVTLPRGRRAAGRTRTTPSVTR